MRKFCIIMKSTIIFDDKDYVSPWKLERFKLEARWFQPSFPNKSISKLSSLKSHLKFVKALSVSDILIGRNDGNIFWQINFHLKIFATIQLKNIL